MTARSRALRSAHDLGRLVRSRRTQLGLDQGSLARRVGVSRQWIVAIEKGKPRAEVELVLRTLAALGLELRWAPAGPTQPSVQDFFAPGLVDIDAIVERARGRAP